MTMALRRMRGLGFEDGGRDNGSPSLYFPYDKGDGLLDFSYQKGARIHSNSWGGWVPSLGSRYVEDDWELDEYVQEHADMLVLTR